MSAIISADENHNQVGKKGPPLPDSLGPKGE